MKAKGAAVITLPIFIKAKFGDGGYRQWVEALSPEAQNIYKKPILVSAWFPLKQIFLEPTKKMCELFYGGNMKGAWECGRFSAEYGLKGIYKIFVRFGSVHFLIKRASLILPSYYDPSHIDVIESGDKHAVVHITKFGEPHTAIDRRIGGWMERALEISGCKNCRVNIQKSLATGDPVTEFDLTWI